VKIISSGFFARQGATTSHSCSYGEELQRRIAEKDAEIIRRISDSGHWEPLVFPVIPAEAGIQIGNVSGRRSQPTKNWIPASAGMTRQKTGLSNA
jgi:hypothetical protein